MSRGEDVAEHEEIENVSEALLGVLIALSEEAEQRPLQIIGPRIIELDGETVAEGQGLIAPGAIVVIVTAPGSPMHARVASISDDPTDLAELAGMALESFGQALAEGGTELSRLAHIAELRYRGKTLGAKIALGEGQAYADAFPYTGGALETSEFALADHPRDRDAEQLRSLVAVCSPRLSPLEREALRLVPSETSEVNISAQPMVVPTAAAAAAAVGAIAFREAARRAAVELARQRARGGIFATAAALEAGRRDLADLPPEPTVGDLLRRRRELLERRLSP